MFQGVSESLGRVSGALGPRAPKCPKGVLRVRPTCQQHLLTLWAHSLGGRHDVRDTSWETSGPKGYVAQKRSCDPNPQYFSKSTAVQMGGVLPYKWEAYCSTNGRRIAGFPFLRSLEARKARRYKWGEYCCTNWRCTALLLRQVVGVGVSETLPSNLPLSSCRRGKPQKIRAP